MAEYETLNFVSEWKFMDQPREPVSDVVPAIVSTRLQQRGIRWLELPVPVGTIRVPVEDDAEFLLESYLELELLYNNKNRDIVNCVLNDGALQFAWSKAGMTFNSVILIVPCLDGRFAQKIEMTVESDCFMHFWRTIAASICRAASTEQP